MASPTVRGTPTIGTGLSRTSDATTAVGDYIVMINWERNGAGSATHTLQGGQDWTEIPNSNFAHNDGSTDGRWSAAVKRVTVAGAQTYQSHTSSDGTSVASCCITVNGSYVDIAALVSVSPITQTTNAVPNPPNLTGMDAGKEYLVFACAGWHLGSSLTVTVTAPTNYALIADMAGANLLELGVATRARTGVTSEDPGTFGDNQTPNGTVGWTFAIPTSVAQAVTGESISGTALNVPTVAHGPQAITGGTISTTSIGAPTTSYVTVSGTVATTTVSVPAAAYRVVGAAVSGTTVTGPEVSASGGAQEVTGANLSSTSMGAPDVAYQVEGASVSATTVSAPSAAYQATGATISSTAVSTPTAAYRVAGASVSTTTVAAPTVSPDQSVTGAFISGTVINAPSATYGVAAPSISASTLGAPTVAYRVVGATQSSTSVSAPTAAYRVAGAAVSDTAVLAPTVIPEHAVTTGTISNTSLGAPSLGEVLAVTTGTISTTTLAAPSAAYRVLPGSLSGTTLSAPSTAYRVAGAAVSGTALGAPGVHPDQEVSAPSIAATALGAPTARYQVAAASLGSGSFLTAPTASYMVALPSVGTSSMYAPGVVGGSTQAITASTIASGSSVYGPRASGGVLREMRTGRRRMRRGTSAQEFLRKFQTITRRDNPCCPPPKKR